MAQQVKNPPDAGLIPELRRSLGVENGNPLQYSCLENFMERGTMDCRTMGYNPWDCRELNTHILNRTQQSPRANKF